MIEMLAIVWFTRHIGTKLEEKGRPSGWYKLLAVVLWFGGEFIGMLVGIVISKGGTGGTTYGLALLGATIGAAIALAVAQSAAPTTS